MNNAKHTYFVRVSAFSLCRKIYADLLIILSMNRKQKKIFESIPAVPTKANILFADLEKLTISLGGEVIEGDGVNTLQMALQAENTDGFLIQNRENSWIGFDKEKVEWILVKY